MIGTTRSPVKRYGMEEPRYGYDRGAYIYLSRNIILPKIDFDYKYVGIQTLENNMEWRMCSTFSRKLLEYCTERFPYLYWQVSVSRWKSDEEDEEDQVEDKVEKEVYY